MQRLLEKGKCIFKGLAARGMVFSTVLVSDCYSIAA